MAGQEELEFHPITTLFPLMEGEDFDRLCGDIQEHGLNDPLVIHEGKILDGRNRYRACLQVGVPYSVKEFSGADPFQFVISANIQRRHLDDGQRAMCAAFLPAMEHGGARRGGSKSPIGGSKKYTAKEAAELFNSSKRSVERARTVCRDGIPGLADAVAKGRMVLNVAVQALKHSKEEQQLAVEMSKLKKVTEAMGLFSKEWFTPRSFVERARWVLGGIDLDPASNKKAQQIVKAEKYHTKKNSGLDHRWHGRVFLNPPYGGKPAKAFAEKAVTEYRVGRVTEMIILTNSQTDATWYQLLASACTCMCHPSPRIRFWFTAPKNLDRIAEHGHTVFYFGQRDYLFRNAFGQHGVITERRDPELKRVRYVDHKD